ncbi:hypothetical protein ACI6Q2_05595 [Chitinophagaceae bacterium LWZ2-11]
MTDQDTLPVDTLIMDEYFSNSYEYAQAIFEVVLSTVIPETIDFIKAGNNMSHEDLRRAVHKVKPSFKMTGFPVIFDEMNKTEELCLGDASQVLIDNKLKHLETLVNESKLILKKQLNYIESQLKQA